MTESEFIQVLQDAGVHHDFYESALNLISLYYDYQSALYYKQGHVIIADELRGYSAKIYKNLKFRGYYD